MGRVVELQQAPQERLAPAVVEVVVHLQAGVVAPALAAAPAQVVEVHLPAAALERHPHPILTWESQVQEQPITQLPEIWV